MLGTYVAIKDALGIFKLTTKSCSSQMRLLEGGMLRTAMFQYVIIIHVTMVEPALGKSCLFNRFIICLHFVAGRFILNEKLL